MGEGAIAAGIAAEMGQRNEHLLGEGDDIAEDGGRSADGYWYYCESSDGYYPYVKECPGGWQRVAPRPSR